MRESGREWEKRLSAVRRACRALQREGVGAQSELRDLFNEELYTAARELGRVYPWRSNRTPYRVLISEVMLQQTQVHRVPEKFNAFVRQFPSFRSLALGEQAQVIRCWQGLGYNRRALFLHALAKEVRFNRNGRLPRDPAELVTLPGIGAYTSCSVPVFAHNDPHVFLETNVRSMCIYFFTSMRRPVSDPELCQLVDLLLDRDDPRTWYEAIMDVGVLLKRVQPGLNRKAAGYARQPTFAGSFRQRRGAVLRAVSEAGQLTKAGLHARLPYPEPDIQAALNSLQKDGFLKISGNKIQLR